MSALDPTATTCQDLCTAALQESGFLGVGQTALAEDITYAWSRLQWMLQQWERKRWLIYHLVTKLVTSTGALTYSVGPGGNIDTGANSARPNRIESAFLRQLVQSQPNQIDYPLQLLQSMEDYNRISLKQLQSFPMAAFYDPTFPLGTLYVWPVMQGAIYAAGITIREQLPVRFLTLATVISLPYEYYGAIVYNLALRVRPKYGIGTFAGDVVPELAKDGLNVLRSGNNAIARLVMPAELTRNGQYNMFNDQFY